MHGALEPHSVDPVDVGQKDRHGRSVGSDARAADEETIEYVEKTGHVAEGCPQVHVLASSVRQERSEFGKTERPQHRHDAGDCPRAKHQRGRAHRLRHDGRLEEDSSADGDSDDHGGCMHERQVAARLGLERGRCGRRRRRDRRGRRMGALHDPRVTEYRPAGIIGGLSRRQLGPRRTRPLSCLNMSIQR